MSTVARQNREGGIGENKQVTPPKGDPRTTSTAYTFGRATEATESGSTEGIKTNRSLKLRLEALEPKAVGKQDAHPGGCTQHRRAAMGLTANLVLS